MSTMIALIGEQPIPNLLPVRYLKPTETILVYTKQSESVAKRIQKLITGATLCEVPAYDFDGILNKLSQEITNKNDLRFNLTGGTKMMALAAFACASQNQHPFLYLQSEGHKNLLFHYQFANGLPKLGQKEELPALITVADYLNAHLPGFKETGFSRDNNGQLTVGGYFEQAVYDALKDQFDEVLAGVKPEGVAKQIDIDLVIRCGNQVGIAEVKHNKLEEGPKRGIDQLNTAGNQGYLGTYTTKFLIVSRKQGKRIKTLAQEQKITIIELQDYKHNTALSRRDRDNLVRQLKDKLCSHR